MDEFTGGLIIVEVEEGRSGVTVDWETVAEGITSGRGAGGGT